MNKRELTAELTRRIKFLKDMVYDGATGEKRPAIAGKLLAYRNVLRLVAQSRMR